MNYKFLVPLVVLLSVAHAVPSNEDQCSYSVFTDCKAPIGVRSNLLFDNINVVKTGSKDGKTGPSLKYGTSEGEEGGEDEVYAEALCPCQCTSCPKPLKSQNSDMAEDECLCACGTCGKTPNKNKLPEVVPVDCNLKCEVISEIQTVTKGSAYGTVPSRA